MAAAAQNKDEPLSEVVITGTHIQGLGPVGSAVIGLDQMQMTQTGITNTSDMLRTLPQVLKFGTGDDTRAGALFQGADLNTTGASGVNLRGLGSASTLSLVNSHRVLPQGPNLQLFDSSSIPMIALERIDVIPDGASAIYGSDAMAGVVNYVTRRPFNGAISSGSFGFADSTQRWKGSQLVSQKWDTGGFLIAAEYGHQDRLAAADRPNLYNDDFSAYGGAPFSSFAAPGNVVIGGVSYAIPTGHATDLQLSDLGAAGTINRENAWKGRDALPKTNRKSVFASFEQDITPNIQIHAEGLYADRSFSAVQERPTATLTVPDTNPFSPCNPAHAPFTNTLGITCTGSLAVQYSLAEDLPNIRSGYERMWYLDGGVKFQLPHEWVGDVSYEHGISEDHSNNVQNLANRGVNLQMAVSAPPSGVPYFNPFCDGSAACQDAATLSYIQDFALTTFHLNRDHLTASFSGPLMSLPGGDVKLAVGAEYLTDDYLNTNENSARVVSNRTPTRKVSTGYGEIYIPVIGDSNAVPGIRLLEVTAAARYEHYSDFGNTFKPKFGLNYKPTNDLKFHGSYGRSFRAPSLADVNPDATAALLPRTINAADIANPGYIGPAGTQGVVAVVGGNSQLQAEKATTWSAGFDWTPEAVEGLTATINYYNIKYTGKIDFPAYNAGPAGAVNGAQYSPFIVLNPAFFSNSQYTAAEYQAIRDALVNSSTPPSYSPYEQGNRLVIGGPAGDPLNAAFILDGRRHNTGIIKTSGLDIGLNYVKMTSFGDIHGGLTGNYVFNYKTADVPGAAIIEKVNFFGYAPRYRMRANVGADVGQWSGTVFVNHAGSYNIDRQYIPAAAPAQYLKVGAYTTVDFSLIYGTGDKPSYKVLQGIQFVLSVQNLFDTNPPLVLNSSAPGIKFDPSSASPLGRLVTLQLTKSW